MGEWRSLELLDKYKNEAEQLLNVIDGKLDDEDLKEFKEHFGEILFLAEELFKRLDNKNEALEDIIDEYYNGKYGRIIDIAEKAVNNE